LTDKRTNIQDYNKVNNENQYLVKLPDILF
jgi:hypothetical protein